MNITATTPVPVHDPAKPAPTHSRVFPEHTAGSAVGILTPDMTLPGSKPGSSFRDGFVDGFVTPFKLVASMPLIAVTGLAEVAGHGIARALEGVGALAGKVSDVIGS